MGKYKAILKTYLQAYSYYRANALIWACHDAISFTMLMIVWSVVFQNNSSIAGFNKNQMISYYFFSLIIKELVFAGGGRNTIASEIYSGLINTYLIKPIVYLKRILIEEISWRFIQVSLFLPILLIIYCLINKSISLSLSIFSFITIVLSLILALFISAFLDYLCGLAAFWLVSVTTFFHLKDIAYWLLSGLAFPTSMLPTTIFNLNLVLPFYYVFAFPIEIITNTYSYQRLIFGFIGQISWIIILVFIYKLAWKKGLKKYDSWGN